MLSDAWIARHAHLLGLHPEAINPISADVTLGAHVVQICNTRAFEVGSFDPLAEPDEMQQTWMTPQVTEYHIPPQGGFTFVPGPHYYLAHTAEDIALPPDVAALVFLKSTSARLGVDHALAGVIEPGFHGQVTLELTFLIPQRFQLGARVAQLVFFSAPGVVTPYAQTGRYIGQQGATRARLPRTPQVIPPPTPTTTRSLSYEERAAKGDL